VNIVKYELTLIFARAAISNPQAACGPVEGFVLPSLGFRCSKNILHTDNSPIFWIWHFCCR